MAIQLFEGLFNTYGKMRLKNFHLYALIILTASSSCTDEFLEVFPEDEYTTDVVYQSETDMILAVNGLYTFLPKLDADRGEPRLWFWTDDGWRRRGRFGADLLWLTNESDNTFNFFRYDGIRQCNEVISRMPAAAFDDKELSARLTAEARLIRAMLYERMVFFYGDVPLVTKPQGADFFPARDPRIEVFNFVLAELAEVATLLPESYSSEDKGRMTKWAALALSARANLNAIGWHPSPTNLYDAAEIACQQIIDSGVFQLDEGIDGFARLFTTASDYDGSQPSTAVLLSRVYIPGELFYDDFSNKCLPRGSYQGFGDRTGNNQGQFGATWNLIRSFQTMEGLAPAQALGVSYFEETPYENMDPRLRASFILPGDVLQTVDGGGTGYYQFQPHPDLTLYPEDAITARTGIETGYLIRKYSGLGVENDSTIVYDSPRVAHADFKLIRYAEVLLMMAECKAADQSLESLEYINQVRNRAGMPPYQSIADIPLSLINGTTGNNLLDAVLLERRYEFVGEGTHRMADIWRYRLGDQVYGLVEGISMDPNRPGALTGERFSAVEKVWNERNYLFPIPQSAIDINANLIQNPGW